MTAGISPDGDVTAFTGPDQIQSIAASGSRVNSRSVGLEMKYTVNVTAEDIENGTPQSCKHCPVAVAIKRISGASWASVDEKEISLCRNEVIHSDRYPTPLCVKDFIRNFDLGENVEPFSFELKSIT